MLSEEERRKIYEEEKARLEAQEPAVTPAAPAAAQRPRKTDPRLLVGGIAVVLVLAGLAIVGNSTRTQTPGASVPPAAAPPSVQAAASGPAVTVVETHPVAGPYSRSIAGTIRNNTDHIVPYVAVTIGLYDKAGAQVGSTLANTLNLGPHEEWKFRAPILEDRATQGGEAQPRSARSRRGSPAPPVVLSSGEQDQRLQTGGSGGFHPD